MGLSTMVFAKLFRRSRAERRAGRALYEIVVFQARRPAFYREGRVPDTVDGRFELISLHAFLLMRRLKSVAAGADVAQALFDEMFADMDRSLREMGAGDLGVGRRVKTMAKAFYGRAAAYDSGMAMGPKALSEALARNLYRAAPVGSAVLDEMTGYVLRECEALARTAPDVLLAGECRFGAPPTPRAAGNAA